MKVTFEGKDYYLYKILFGVGIKRYQPPEDDGFEVDKYKKPFFYY